MKIVELELKDLEIPQGLLPRVLTGTVEEKVREYADLIEEGVEFDPILVWEREDGRYWVIDGVHRVEAHKEAGKERIKAKLLKCRDELDYRIRAIQANLKHGLALSKGERPILAQTLYRQGLSEEEIKKVFGVSLDTVRKWIAPVKQEEKREKIRRAVELREKGWSLDKIAKELGVDKATVSRWLQNGKAYQNATPLLTPTSDPTPEGIRLFEEHLRSQDRLPPAWNWENFSRWLERENKQVEGDIKEFVMCFIKPISKAFKLFAQEGETDYNAVKKYLSSKEPLSKLTSPSREKLFVWAERYWKKEVEKAQKQKELEEKILSTAEEILKDPSYTLTNWIDLSEEVAQKLGLSFEEVNPIISQHVTHLTEVYRQIPGVPEERIKEILSETPLEEFENSDQLVETIKAQVNQEGFRWTQKAEWAVINAYKEFEKAPPSPHDSSSPVPPGDPSAGSEPAPSEEDPYADREAILRKAEEAWERMHAQTELATEKEEKKKEPSNRGRPAKPHYNVEEEIEIIIEEIKERFWKLVVKCGGGNEGRSKAFEIFERIYEELKAEVRA